MSLEKVESLFPSNTIAGEEGGPGFEDPSRKGKWQGCLMVVSFFSCVVLHCSQSTSCVASSENRYNEKVQHGPTYTRENSSHVNIVLRYFVA